jgi:Family of unknown function (DUF6527)
VPLTGNRAKLVLLRLSNRWSAQRPTVNGPGDVGIPILHLAAGRCVAPAGPCWIFGADAERAQTMGYEFVDRIPERLEPSVLYLCVKFATAVHLCACGCQREVVTPLTPTDWAVTFDGVSVSLSPSIGNWSFPCQSHYWIRRNRVEWARSWSSEDIAKGRQRDSIRKNAYFAGPETSDIPRPATQPTQPRRFASLRRRLARFTRT